MRIVNLFTAFGHKPDGKITQLDYVCCNLSWNSYVGPFLEPVGRKWVYLKPPTNLVLDLRGNPGVSLNCGFLLLAVR